MEPTKDQIALLIQLEQVENAVVEIYDQRVAYGPAEEFDAARQNQNSELQKQLDKLEGPARDFQPALAYLEFIRGRLVATKQGIASNRGMLKCKDHYQRAIDLGYSEGMARYYWGIHNLLWGDIADATAQFERVLGIAGPDSDLGRGAAAKLAAARTKKSGGCLSVLVVSLFVCGAISSWVLMSI